MTESRISTLEAGRSQPAPPQAPLILAIGTWVLAGIIRGVAAGSSGPASEKAGAVVGTLFGTLLIVFVVRSIARLVRRKPVLSRAWTPALFFSAAVLALLSLAGSSGQD